MADRGPAIEKALLLDDHGLAFVENAEAPTHDGFSFSRSIGEGQPRSEVLVVVDVRLELMAQPEHDAKRRPHADVVLKEREELMLIETHCRGARVHRKENRNAVLVVAQV